MYLHVLHTERAAILDVENQFLLMEKCRKSKESHGISRREVVAKAWGNLTDFVGCVDVIIDAKAVRPGSTFLTDLGIKMISVNFDISFQEKAITSM